MNIKKFKMFESESKIDIYVEDILEILNNKHDDYIFSFTNDTIMDGKLCKIIKVKTKEEISSYDVFMEKLNDIDKILRNSMFKSYCDKIILRSIIKKPGLVISDLVLDYYLYDLVDEKKKNNLMFSNLETSIKSSINSYFQRGYGDNPTRVNLYNRSANDSMDSYVKLFDLVYQYIDDKNETTTIKFVKTHDYNQNSKIYKIDIKSIRCIGLYGETIENIKGDPISLSKKVRPYLLDYLKDKIIKHLDNTINILYKDKYDVYVKDSSICIKLKG